MQNTGLEGYRRLLIADCGCDRATAYTMNNKLVRKGDLLFCTWLDNNFISHITVVDTRKLSIIVDKPIAQGLDNHCGTTLEIDTQGSIHAITGGHHSPMQYSVWRMENTSLVCMDHQFLWHGTYPSMICSSDGKLHLAYRLEADHWEIRLGSKKPQGDWHSRGAVIRSSISGYQFFTNTIAQCPTKPGDLYLGFAYYLKGRAKHRKYLPALLEIHENDEYITLETDTLKALSTPFCFAELDEGNFKEKGPAHISYRQHILSNLSINKTGQVAVVIHDTSRGSAMIGIRHSNKTINWISLNLKKLCELEDSIIGPSSALHLADTGQMTICIQIHPTSEVPIMGNPNSQLLILVLDASGNPISHEFMTAEKPNIAWLPSIERHHFSQNPAILYTEGINLGGFDNNINRTITNHVWLYL